MQEGKQQLKKLFLQVLKFIGFSGIGWILDFSVYTGLGFFSSNLDLNNRISSWVGVTFVSSLLPEKYLRIIAGYH